jgi:hypothetical protein
MAIMLVLIIIIPYDIMLAVIGCNVSFVTGHFHVCVLERERVCV